MLTMLLFTSLLWAKDAPTKAAGPVSLSDITVMDIDAKPVKFKTFQGKVLLIVNTASECGFTPQFKGLQALQDEFGRRGFQVLGFPSNDFNQEKAAAADTKKVACDDNGVKFPLMQTSKVRGPERNAVFDFLVRQSANPGVEVGWNFEKFLVDRSGKVRGRFLSAVAPEDPKLKTEIEKLLR